VKYKVEYIKLLIAFY